MEGISSLYPQRLKAGDKEIRLLVIDSRLPEQCICCSLRTVSLNNTPKYTALSYAWGDARITVPIAINGVSVHVTTNLESALRHNQKSTSDQVFWVDAVCIHQADIVERNAQVSMMGAIYSQATSVLVWLGESDLASDEIAKTISEISMSLDDTHPTKKAELDALKAQRVLLAMRAIAKRPWFKRVWVIQECLLAREDPIFQCGPTLIPWGSFFELFWDVFEKSIRNPSEDLSGDSYHGELTKRLGLSRTDFEGHGNELLAVNMVGVLRHHANQGFFPTYLSGALAASLGRLASVPHDYIYGFLGLVSDDNKEKVFVDYQRSHWDLYREVMDFIICRGEADDLHFLSMISFKSHAEQHPSWVVDFSAQTNVTKYTGNYLASQDFWRPSWDVWTSDDGDIFMLEGVCLDVVARAHAIPETSDIRDQWAVYLKALNILAKSEVSAQAQVAKGTSQIPPPRLCEVSRTSSLHQLFLANSDPSRFRSNPLQTMDGGRFRVRVEEKQWEYWWNALLDLSLEQCVKIDKSNGMLPQAELNGLSIRAFVLNIIAATWTACSGRTLVITRGGLLAIAVPDVHEGDVLAYLFGLHAPLILRPSPKKSYYTIIGSAFVHGLMDWVTLDECYNEGLLSVATFRIR